MVDADYYSCLEDDPVTCTDPGEAIGEYLDSCDGPIPRTVTLRGFVRLPRPENDESDEDLYPARQVSYEVIDLHEWVMENDLAEYLEDERG